ncbi:MAG: hypothetical protein ACR2RV_10775 [Verrucomicrobiales bacterium]
MDETNPDQKATLGCGTLILIALIVIIFSKGGADELEKELRRTTMRLEAVESGIDDQNAQLDRLRATLERQTQEISALRRELVN